LIKAIIFDLGRVIVPFDFGRVYSALEPLCGLGHEEMRDKISRTGLVNEFECGQIDSASFVQRVGANLGVDIEHDEFEEIWNSIFFRETLISDEFLGALGKNYPLILLSNTNAMHFQMIRRDYPLLRHFNKFVLSYEVGAMKPSPVIYQAAVDAAGQAAGECFFTDDIPEYVQGAKKAGIDAVQFESEAQIQAELKARGVTWQGEASAPLA
jgi:FMN phosphatase YigB (HAD superfamily)